MLYNIHISQIALNNIGIDTLDYNDLAIFNVIEFACANGDTVKLTEAGNQYTMTSTTFITEQLPFLQHNSTETIKRRIKKLIDVGLVESFDKNQSIQRSYYKMGKLYSKYKSYSKNESSLSKMKDKTVKNERLPMSKMKDYNNINNNNINNNSSTENKLTKSKVLNLFNSSYPKTINRATFEPILIQFDGDLNELVNGLQRYTKYCKAVKPKLQHIISGTNFIKSKRYMDGFEYTKDPEEERIEHAPKLKIIRADR